ncbi:succinylglutamate desuccinylase [Roseiterribacter gracilis]|uniref:Succinylglutamate desuccinylase n=1 Tax=Roseiterribacter gracilis TaxID=2812848 RepID=A0A8S8XB11_9PROT|nr:succinylglutamate desuccinylase [Rhodospirillales bacterium TMPK1]
MGKPDPYIAEIAQPDLAFWRSGSHGTPYVWRFDSGRPGPRVWLNALTHGNEACGALALTALLRRNPVPLHGTLTISFANPAAALRSSGDEPLGVRCIDEDLNRVWGRMADRSRTYEMLRARELRPLAHDCDVLLDLHAMTHPTEPLAIIGLIERKAALARSRALAEAIGFPTLLIADAGHASGVRLRDYGPFAADTGNAAALLVECGGWWEARSVSVAFDVVARTLAAFAMLPDDVIDTYRSEAPPLASQIVPRQRLVEAVHTITIATDQFRFAEDFRGDEVIPNAGTVIAWDGDQAIETPFDSCFLMFPTTKPQKGATAIRLGRFV